MTNRPCLTEFWRLRSVIFKEWFVTVQILSKESVLGYKQFLSFLTEFNRNRPNHINDFVFPDKQNHPSLYFPFSVLNCVILNLNKNHPSLLFLFFCFKLHQITLQQNHPFLLFFLSLFRIASN